MPLASKGTAGTAGERVADAQVVGTTVTTAIDAGDLIVAAFATDNRATTDGDDALHTSVIVGGLTLTKAREFTNGQGGVSAGATVSVWYGIANVAMPTGTAFEGNVAVAKDAKALSLHVFTKGTGTTISVDGGASLANDGVVPGSMTVGGLASKERLWLRGIGRELNSGTQLTPTAGHTAIALGYASGTASTSMAVLGEFIVKTDTTDTSNPTGGLAADHASVMVVLSEAASGTAHTASITDTLALADQVTDAHSIGHVVTPGDSLTLADSTSSITAKGLADTLTLTDASRAAVERATADTLTLADSVAAGLFFSVNPADTLSLTDGVTPLSAVGYAVTVTDTLALVDLVARAVNTGLADTVGVIDAVTSDLRRALEHAVADALVLADAASMAFVSALADPLALTDIVSHAYAQVLADAVAMADLVALAVQTGTADALSLADAVTPQLGGGGLALERAFADALGLADQLGFAVRPTFADMVNLADALRFDAGAGVSDTLVTADALGLERRVGLADTLTLADAVILGALVAALGLVSSSGTAAISKPGVASISGSGLASVGSPGKAA